MRSLIDLLVPSCCDGCGARAAPPWCADCEAQAWAWRPAHPCRRCAGPDDPGHACWAPDAPIDATLALTRWSGVIATALTQAKLAGRSEVFRALGRDVAAMVIDAGVSVQMVVPVPTDTRRARARGSDHTLVLARAVGAALAVPAVRAVRPRGRLPDQGLRHHAAAGSGVTDAARRGGRVVVPRPALVDGARVLLVDDLVTTGATLLQSAVPLRAAGAQAISVAVLARAGSHPLRGSLPPAG